ncbi:IclR family transcriptional regulator C-terminal domain-containing protein [Streptomyces sp. NPDC006552]|uniref:IclR family transcriptional regulator n=1 Tax=Streptomyces sp. NPDC006552 TaxID=3157179 RepID=UPI0033B209D6
MALKHEPETSTYRPHRSVRYALRVLEAVDHGGTGITDAELVRETGLPADRLTPLLRMLRREGYVRQTSDGAYVTGEALSRIGSVGDGASALTAKLQVTLDKLRDTVGAAVYMSRYIDGEVHITQYAAGPGAPAVNEWVDFRVSAHASAVGKSLLGQLDLDGRRDHLSRHKMVRLTSRTITSEKVLLTKLATQPATVPVLDLQEYAVGTVCAAVPITAGSAVGCLALSLPLAHAHRLHEAARHLNRSAAPVALSLTI